jgi:glycosyltransferase involved in cell wall biosynthesis
MPPTEAITALFLPNVRQRGASRSAGHGPDRERERSCFAAHGIVQANRDLHPFPLNPLARHGTFYAGFDLLRALRVLLFDRRADVIVSVFESNVAIILLLGRLLRFPPRIVLWEVSARGWSLRDRVRDFVLPRVDMVLVHTSHEKRTVERRHRLKAPAELIGFAVDDRFYQPMPVQDGGYILAVGDDIGRDYPTLIAACRGTPFRLVLRTSARPLVPQDMRDQVSIRPRLSYPALRELYAAATIVVTPLRRGVEHSSGITALYESMAMGRPVIATDAPGTRDILRHGRTGLLVAAGDVAELRQALIALVRDPARRARLGAAARAAIDSEAMSYDGYITRFAAGLRRAAGRA